MGMMGWLLFLQPMAQIMALVLGIVGGVGFAVACCVRMEHHKDEKTNALAKLGQKFFAILFVVSLPFVVVASSWAGYKNIIVYRAINSETTEKAVTTLEKLLDKVGDKIDDM